jgi:hypothetical protein
LSSAISELRLEMDINPPPGSKISVVSDGADPIVVIPAPSSPMRYFTGLFLVCWLGGWALGEKHAVSEILSGRASAFLIFWLGAWTLGGIFAAYSAYRSLRPPVPETLQLQRSGISYDSGLPPIQLNSWRNANTINNWRSAFPKRVLADLDRRELQSLRLRETESGNRLTVDVEAERVEIASGASEVEREWLARLLARRYSLPQVFGGAAANGGA